jgi:DNA-binding LytR/AlgR family response regulator
MNCVVIDKNPVSNKLITDFINQDPLLKLKASCFTAFEAMEVMQNQTIDLIVVDTQLTPISGISFVRSLVNRPLVILTSPDGLLAAEAFDLDVTDYIVKPVTFERFFKSIQKARETFHLKRLRTEKARSDESNSDAVKGYILVKSDYNTIKINLGDILFVEGLKDYIKIYTVDNKKPVITLNSLKKMTQALPATHFARIHKSYIIAFEHITSINKAQVIIGDSYIPIGESYKSYFLSMLEKRTI